MPCIRIALGCCHSVTGVWLDADYPYNGNASGLHASVRIVGCLYLKTKGKLR